MDGLCYRCKEDIEKGHPIILGFLHCHHEPKEKNSVIYDLKKAQLEYEEATIKYKRHIMAHNKSKCEACDVTFLKRALDLEDIKGNFHHVIFNLCPECGRRL